MSLTLRTTLMIYCRSNSFRFMAGVSVWVSTCAPRQGHIPCAFVTWQWSRIDELDVLSETCSAHPRRSFVWVNNINDNIKECHNVPVLPVAAREERKKKKKYWKTVQFQFSPLTDWVAGGTWGTIQQWSSSSPFNREAILSSSSMGRNVHSFHVVHPAFRSSADHGVALSL